MDFDGSRHLAFNRDASAPLLNSPELRVYAAGALTNVDQDVNRDCLEIRAIVKRVLESYDFQGIGFRVYDPGDITQPGSNHTAEEVYELNYLQSILADLVIFHVNVPSLGVGCEAQIAADATVPRITLAKKSVAVSRMFAGIFSATLASIEYDSYADAELQLFRLLPTIAEETIQSARRRRSVLAAFSELQLGLVIFKQRIIHNVTIDQLAQETDIKKSWLQKLERNPVMASCCSAIQLNRIASVTHCYVRTVDPSNLTTLVPSTDSLGDNHRDSLDNLTTYILAKDQWVPDDRVFRLWNEYCGESEKEVSEALEFREGSSRVISADEWRRRDQQQPRLF